MTHQFTPTERQLVVLIEKLPVAAEKRTAWSEQIRSSGLTVELADEIRAELAAAEKTTPAEKARYEVELARLVRKWRLDSGAHSFHR